MTANGLEGPQASHDCSGGLDLVNCALCNTCKQGHESNYGRYAMQRGGIRK